nr:signal peptidase I [uncultured Holophaga sp.]
MKHPALYPMAMALALSPLLFVHPVRIQGESMAPTLQSGQLCWALRAWCSRAPHRGDIWVVQSPEGQMVKRVIALPGERLELQDGTFMLDEHPLEEDYVQHPERGSAGPWEAGRGYLLLGDNRPASRDGRQWGSLNRKRLSSRLLIK